MSEFLSNPLSLVFALPVVIGLAGTLAHHWYLARKAELDTSLKHEMIQRGMSADEIRLVLDAHGSISPELLAADKA